MLIMAEVPHNSMLLTITKRLDDWGHLTLLESFIRRAEIQTAIHTMINDIRITSEKLQVSHLLQMSDVFQADQTKLTIGPELDLSSAEMAHLDIQDSLQINGVLRYIAGRPNELRALTELPFTPSDCQSFAIALQSVRGFHPLEKQRENFYSES